MRRMALKCILLMTGVVYLIFVTVSDVRASDSGKTAGDEEKYLIEMGYPGQWANSLGERKAVNEVYEHVKNRCKDEGLEAKGMEGNSISLGDGEGELRWDYVVYSRGESVVYVDVAVNYRWMTEQADCWDDWLRLEYDREKLVFDSDRFMTWNFVKDKRDGRIKGYNSSDALAMFSVGSMGWFPEGKNPSFVQTLQYEQGGGALITMRPSTEVLETDQFVLGAEYVRGSLEHLEVFQGILAGLLVVFGIYWCGRKKQG